MDKQGYLENRLEELGGLRFNKGNIKVGYIVLIKRWGEVEVLSTGPQNIVFKILSGGAAGGTLQAAYAEIDKIVRSEEKQREPHPFKVGERFTATQRTYPENSMRAIETQIVYEIVKASATTIQLRPVGTDTKPITRKPVKTYGGKWRFSVDDSYGNTFYKKEERYEKIDN